MKQSLVYQEIAPYLRLPVDFLHTNQCTVDKHFRVSDARHSRFSMRIGLECEFILHFPILIQFQTHLVHPNCLAVLSFWSFT